MNDAARILERLDRVAEAMAMQAANVAELATGLKLNGVVYSGTVVIGADGSQLVQARSNFASATVRAAGADVTIATQGQGASAPTSGPGVFVIPAGTERTVAITGNVLTLYGTAGASVAVTLWVYPQPPASSSTQPASAAVAGATGAPVRIAGAIASTTLAAANPARRGLLIFNDNAVGTFLYVSLGPTAAVGGPFSVRLDGGSFFELPGPPFYTGIVTGIWSAAAGAAQVTELQ